MINLEVKTKLKQEEVIEQAEEIFRKRRPGAGDY